MSINIDLMSVERIVRAKLDAYSLKKIEKSLNEYLGEATKENIARTIGIIYQSVRKNYKLKKSTARGEEFWKEIARLWYYADCAFYTRYYQINNWMPFNYKRAEEVSSRILKSIYGDIFTAYNIAEHETLGGLHSVAEAMINKMRETAEEIFVSGLIDKHFGKYKESSNVVQYFHAVQYIAVKYLLRYRPDLQASQYNHFRFITYKDLERILTMHLEEYKY